MVALKLTNTYTGKLEEFIPINKGEVSIYVCGPTVYNYMHIGNARPWVVFDTFRRYLEAKGFLVRFASNFTDVDDRIIAKAKETGKSETEISEYFIQACQKDIVSLNCLEDYLKPRVTEYIPLIIDYISELVNKGYAYVVEGDVFFRVEKITEYGHLSKRKLDDLIQGARVEINPLKESPLDFVLWKKTDEGLNWESPFSKGRPGWHTECVVMIDALFNNKIDIHGGGADLIFPHHENEIAQSLACRKHTIANYWMHNGRLQIENEVMSKSLGNVVLIKDFSYNMMALRLLLLSTHYRAPINYTEQSIRMFAEEWDRIEATLNAVYRKLDLASAGTDIAFSENQDTLKAVKAFNEAMDNDFNTPNAITELQALVKVANVEIRKGNDFRKLAAILNALGYMLDVLGLKANVKRLTEDDVQSIRKWEALRKEKRYAEADELRRILQEKGLF